MLSQLLEERSGATLLRCTLILHNWGRHPPSIMYHKHLLHCMVDVSHGFGHSPLREEAPPRPPYPSSKCATQGDKVETSTEIQLDLCMYGWMLNDEKKKKKEKAKTVKHASLNCCGCGGNEIIVKHLVTLKKNNNNK